jgi:hypothetical protein
MRLAKSTYEWALKHLMTEGDTDLFPPLFEIEAIKHSWSSIVDDLCNLDVASYEWKGGRRFVVPKNMYSFRFATQLDPLDNLILAAIIKKYGQKIENKRLPASNGNVFSYRFQPLNDGRFYGPSTNWHDFWKASLEKASAPTCSWVVITDITDYYNQIYHHVLKNQLDEAGVPQDIVNTIKKFLSTLTEGVSRGIPVGPHCTHLLAECAMNTTDRSLLSQGHDFCRYVDDVHFFCKTKEEAQVTIYSFAEILDKQQRLTIQNQKTKVLPSGEFCELAQSMLVDQPLNDAESQLLAVISKHTCNDPYLVVSLTDLDEKELLTVRQDMLESLFDLYLSQTPINYARVGWLLRRLSQVGAPGGIGIYSEEHRKFDACTRRRGPIYFARKQKL